MRVLHPHIMFYWFIPFLLFLSVSNCSNQAPPFVDSISFINPLLPAGPDPWVIQKDSFYYYTNTLGDRIDIWKTRSLSRLKNAQRKTVWRPPANSANTYNVWAPELHYLDNKWYLYYTAGSSIDRKNQLLFVLENESADPMEGTWVDKGKIYDPQADIYAIDATVLEYREKKYLVWSSLPKDNYNKQSIFIAEMKNPWTLATGRVLITNPQYYWEKIGSSENNGVNEGPEILKNSQGQVFLIFSASGCWTDGYSLGMMSLKNGGNPLTASDWVKRQKSVFMTSERNHAFGPGHNAFFKSPDGKEDWIIYHANSNAGQQCSDLRNPRIQKFIWNADGSPNFGEPVPINTRILRPSGEKD